MGIFHFLIQARSLYTVLGALRQSREWLVSLDKLIIRKAGLVCFPQMGDMR